MRGRREHQLPFQMSSWEVLTRSFRRIRVEGLEP